MSETDVVIKKFAQKWILPSFLLVISYILLKKYGPTVRDRILAIFWNKQMDKYHSALYSLKEIHYKSMNYHRSADVSLRNKGIIRILEIGAASGANFQFYPPNSRLTVVEPNAYFEPFFYERASEHKNVQLEKFVLGNAENMKEVQSNSIDVVVSSLVLCSVKDLEKALEEVQRVLAPGGKFYYWEHVHDHPGTWLHTIQNVLTWFIWAPICGCYLNRNIGNVIASKGFSSVEQHRFNIPLKTRIHRLIRVHLKGVATK